MSQSPTLKDIAKALGVTPTTVHRALQGKAGVSQATRQRVRQTAQSMGYRANYMAAALKRKEIRLAIALPEPTGDSRYYYGSMWAGVRRFLAEVADFHLQPLEYSYPLVPGGGGGALQQVWEDQGAGLEGLLAMGADQGQAAYYLEKFAGEGVPVVLVGSDGAPGARLCCVKADDAMAGSLAAELLTSFDSDASPKKVACVGHFGQLGLSDQVYNARGFESYLAAHAPHMEVLHLRGEDPAAVCAELAALVQRDPAVYAVYACSARYSVRMAQALAPLALARPPKLIGSDAFAESLALLGQGALGAIIDKQVARQSRLAAQTLFDYAVKGQYPPRSLIEVRPQVVLRSHKATDDLEAQNGIHG